MDMRIELVFVPVTDVDRAIEFYRDKVGFTLDVDVRVDENTRFVQLTPPGSACSIAIGEGISEMAPGSQDGIQVVVDDAEAARSYLLERRRDRRRPGPAVGIVHRLHRPRRQRVGPAAAAATGLV